MLKEGISALASAAADAYGTQKKVQFRRKDGGYGFTCSFSDLLERAVFEEEPLTRAASILEESGLPQDGVKTMLLILDALLTYGVECGCTAEDWRQVNEILDYGVQVIPKLAAEHNGKVVGGGPGPVSAIPEVWSGPWLQEGSSSCRFCHGTTFAEVIGCSRREQLSGL